MLKPQDCVVLLKLIANQEKEWSQRELAKELVISLSEINKSTGRLLHAGLLRKESGDSKKLLPVLSAAEKFLIHGLPYSFATKLGALTPGMPTAVAASIFKEHILLGDEPAPVWPYAKGKVKGVAVEPLYKTVPQALHEYPDQNFYDLLALVDAMRVGRARERNIAMKLIKERIYHEQ